MRILVMYDLPQNNFEDNKEYLKFRKFLLKDGFKMYQYSIYIRACVNDIDAKKHIYRIKNNPPKDGNISILKITEKQFEEIIKLRGKEKFINDNDFTIFV